MSDGELEHYMDRTNKLSIKNAELKAENERLEGDRVEEKKLWRMRKDLLHDKIKSLEKENERLREAVLESIPHLSRNKLLCYCEQTQQGWECLKCKLDKALAEGGIG